MLKPMRKFIVLLTDFGMRDAYAGTMKGVISSINQDVVIYDLTHEIPAQDVEAAGVILSSAYSFFPKQSIFVAVVDPGVGSQRPIIALKTDSYIFLAPDNGLLSLVAQRENVRGIFKVVNKKYFLKDISSTFHGRDIFAPVAAYLSMGARMEDVGVSVQDMVRLNIAEVKAVEGRSITGKVIYVDRFGNILTNISGNQFSSFISELKKQEIFAEVKRKTITRFVDRYEEGLPGELIMLKGSSGYMEISINKGSAIDTLKVSSGDTVEIRTNIG